MSPVSRLVIAGRRGRNSTTGVALAASLLAATAFAGPPYRQTDLKGGHPVVTATDISPDGKVVGWWNNGGFQPTTQGFVWIPDEPNGTTGTNIDLGNFGFIAFYANGINDAGQIAASGVGDGYGNAYRLENGQLLRLETGILPGGCHPYTGCGAPSFMSGGANAINATGQVAGQFGYQGSVPAFWADPVLSNTPPEGQFDALAPSGYGFAYAVNDAGLVVGQTNYFGDTPYGDAFLWDGTIHNLGVIEGSNFSVAYDINNSGVIVGNSGGVNGDAHAFVYSNGTMLDIHSSVGGGYGSSVATGINNLGEVVGARFTPSASGRAFLRDAQGGVKDLSLYVTLDPNTVLTGAGKINDAGQIIASTSNGLVLLLTPDPVVLIDGFE